MIPQIIFLMLGFGGLCIELSKHGEEKTGKYNAWYSLIAVAITWSLLYWGGFFNAFL